MPQRVLAVLFLVVFINLCGFGLVIPLLPLYARDYGASGATIGAIVAVYSLMQFVFSPMWGRLSDRVGRRRVLLLCLAGAGIGHLLFAAAGSIPLLFLARIVAGLFAATLGTAYAAAADVTSPAQRARGMGVVGAAFGLGFVFGPPLGGLLATASAARGLGGNVVPGLFAAALTFAALLVTFFALPETKTQPSPAAPSRPPQFDPTFWRAIAGSPALRSYFFTFGALVLALTGLETIVPIVARERLAMTPRDVGLLFGFLGAVMALVQATVVGPLVRAVGERRLLLIATSGLALALAAVPISTHRGWLYAIAAVVATAEGLALPAIQSLISGASPAAQQGIFLGMLAATGSLAQMAGGLSAGMSYGWAGAHAPFYGAAAIVAVTVCTLLRTPADTSISQH